MASLVWHFLWCCAIIAALVISDEVYPWVSGRQMGRDPARGTVFYIDRAIVTHRDRDEFCAPDNPDRSVFTKSALDACDRWEKSRSGQ
jgi:hypothetical protein